MIRERQRLNYIARSWAEAQAIRWGIKHEFNIDVGLLTAASCDTEFSYYVTIEKHVNNCWLAQIDAFARGVAFGRG